MKIYCLKCKKKTDSVKLVPRNVKKRIMVQSPCAICGTKKSQFIN